MEDQLEYQPNTPVGLTADIVAAYVSGNHVQVAELPTLIVNVHAMLSELRNGKPAEPAGPEKPTAAQIRKSVTPDALVSFLDGKPYKTLKRHLNGNGLSFEEYRTRYGLPADYPSTSANYSATRSALARSLGLGQQRRKQPAAAAAVEATAEAPKARGRKPKAAESPKAVEASQAEGAPTPAPKTRGRKGNAKTIAEPA
ncbi:MucR family transcriptional regulator [Methylobacterium sp. E-041]|uniref:MucR family transcriptional regulator n=1 Tax=Methylobacterium sp. E-041 TaxID=2836573 RepID=UPI001FB9E726|nr:MucR family transcriptional regulator [Methylobacterium sp. E-041]MCJ2108764.1 MucR family transcriptional regulator [Methylobacterium sp. E-041]